MATSKVVPYTLKERLLVVSLVDKHKSIVENKKTDATTIQSKQKEWEIIAFEYNSQADIITTKRTAAQLKKLWNNLKQKKRKTNTDEKYTRLLTGGGPPIEFEKDPVMDAVDIAAPHADVTLSCTWDSTATYMKENGISGSLRTGEVATMNTGINLSETNHPTNTFNPRQNQEEKLNSEL
ncbi:hypothetical protein NQ315_016692 [Exocentrus adspersus]|uniref:Regulatory protein zeste n=1 Tax=Exocentrus adspersus TaxID=1586481 RepID=A0AAV8VES4_9CUCU|nr:hypothetical protein NQ315_016692 [Exocentrus adspersus]